MRQSIPNMPESLGFLATLGVGGVLAGMMFMVYRKDVRQHTELWHQQTTILMAVVNKNTEAITTLIERSAIAEQTLIAFGQRLEDHDERAIRFIAKQKHGTTTERDD